MRQVWLTAAEQLSVREVPAPVPGPRDLRVRPHSVGICGSDLHALHGDHPFIDLPVVPGHEAAGVVDATGEEVVGFAIGDRVLLEPNLVDGTCLYCRTGRYNLCESLQVVGCQGAGALAEAFIAPAERFHHMPDGMSFSAAALVEPLSTATHAVRVAGGAAGATVAVLGAGSIGLLTMLACRAAGAEAVVVTDPLAVKRELAEQLGADASFDPAQADVVAQIRGALPRRPDIVFDCVSVQASLDQAIGLALNGGTVVVVGVPVHDVTVPLALVQDRELRLQGTAMYVKADVLAAIDLIERGHIPVQRLVSAEFGLDDAADAFRVAREGWPDRPAVKIQFDPQR